MDHQTAIRIDAAERYCARELTPEERDAFEEHFFECAECAEEVHFEQVFAANTRAVLLEESDQPEHVLVPRWEAPRPSYVPESIPWYRRLTNWPVLVPSLSFNFALLAFVFYQSGKVIPALEHQVTRLSTPQLASVVTIPTIVRGDVKVIQIPQSAGNVVLSFGITRPFPKYEWQILDESGSVRLSGSQPAPPAASDELALSLPVFSLAPGVYTATVRGLDGSERLELGHSRIRVQ